MTTNLNCLSYWFPKLLSAGLPVPRTEIVCMSPESREAIYAVFDGRAIGVAAASFFAELRTAVEKIGTPAFLRTGQGSGKHQWDDCCNLRDAAALEHHVLSLIEWSELVDMIGLPVDVWAAREFLPTTPTMVADRYGNMPVCREIRFFVRDAEILCFHPYWTKGSLVQGMSTLPEDFEASYERLCTFTAAQYWEALHLASRAGAALGGAWSIDILETRLHNEHSLFITDCAEAHRSFHWEGCDVR